MAKQVALMNKMYIYPQVEELLLQCTTTIMPTSERRQRQRDAAERGAKTAWQRKERRDALAARGITLVPYGMRL